MPNQQIQQGPKGGLFRVSDSGNKIYHKSQVKKQKINTKKTQLKTKPWRSVEPTTKGQRGLMLKKCGPMCFLDPENKKYPVCETSKCKPTCQGIRAAKSRAGQWRPDLLLKANILAVKNKCFKSTTTVRKTTVSKRKNKI